MRVCAIACISFLYSAAALFLTGDPILSILRAKLSVKKLYTLCAQVLNSMADYFKKLHLF